MKKGDDWVDIGEMTRKDLGYQLQTFCIAIPIRSRNAKREPMIPILLHESFKTIL